ncbi:MAG: hypothetical protein IJX19_04565 [Clostridia bacterium]|nr:hypothetical protein [Clostridia bacterium]
MDFNQNVNTEIPARANGTPLKRKKYLFTASPKITRILSFVALGLAALFLLLTVIGTISSLNRDFWDIPLFSMVLSKSELNELEDGCDEALDAVEDAIKDDDKDAIANLENDFDMNVKQIKKTLENPSLLNLSAIFVGLGEAEESLAAGMIIALILGFAAFVLLFAALATLFLKKGLLITAYIFAIPFHLLFTGSALLVISTIVLVAFFVVLTIVNKDYKTYKKSFAQ